MMKLIPVNCFNSLVKSVLIPVWHKIHLIVNIILAHGRQLWQAVLLFIMKIDILYIISDILYRI